MDFGFSLPTTLLGVKMMGNEKMLPILPRFGYAQESLVEVCAR